VPEINKFLNPNGSKSNRQDNNGIIQHKYNAHSKQEGSGGGGHNNSNYNSTQVSDGTIIGTSPSPNPPLMYGLTPGEALQRYKDELTMFEKTELSNFDQIFTVGSYRR
jgi:hypothetical protein